MKNYFSPIFNYSSFFKNELYAFMSKNPPLANRIDYLQNFECKVKNLAIPHQIHSNKVKWINSVNSIGECDGLFTSNQQIVLSLQTADCVPVFLYDLKTKTRGLVHAGWRGIVSGIIENGIELMLSNKSKKENIIVYMGPSICENCYEVGEDVGRRFLHSRKSDLNENKYYVDLSKELINQIIRYKIPDSNISKSRICTFESLECCSYRRDGLNASRMFSFMGVVNGSF